MTAPAEKPTGPPSAGSSVWLVAQRPLSSQRRGRFVAESRQHPGRMSPDLAAEAIRRFTCPGDLVFDPMCGIGTTLVEAVHAGRHAFGIEYEEQWGSITRANLDLARMQGAPGRATVVTGDARLLDELHPKGDGRPLSEATGRARLLLTSPPYGPSTHGRVLVAADGPVVSHLEHHYTRGRRRGGREANLAYVDHDSLTAGMSDIFTAAMPLLAPDAVVAVTARPWRQNGLLVDLPGLVITAAEIAGLHLVDRCVALLAEERTGRLKARHSFFQLLAVRNARARGDDWLLIAHEDVLVFNRVDFAGARVDNPLLDAPGGTP